VDFSSSPSAPLPLLWWVKFLATLCVALFALLFTIPTFLGPSDTWPKEKDRFVHWYHNIVHNYFPDSRIALGLDLKGGLHLVLEVDVEKSVQDSISRAVQRAKDSLQDMQNIVISLPAFVNKYDFQIHAADDKGAALQAPEQEKLVKAIQEHTSLVMFDTNDNGNLKFKGVTPRIQTYSTHILQQALGTIRNRIDQFGVAEPSLFQQGENRIVVQMPGLQDVGRAKELIGNTAQLDFRLVLSTVDHGKLPEFIKEGKAALKLAEDNTSAESMEQVSQWLRDQKKIPENATLVLQRVYETQNNVSKLTDTIPYVVEAQSKLTGDLIEKAEARTVQAGLIPEHAVMLTFNPQGGKIFADLTKAALEAENKSHQIAIILDGNVSSAPTVNEPILNGQAMITMNRRGMDPQEKIKEAQDLALVLRAGSLPASVHIVEERQVGPSEGEENIRAGVQSSLLAAALVILLMWVIYGNSGLVANVAMLLNVLLILAFLAAFGATLTLPGIAGIVLTMAMAVDGNVIINERIREELRNGCSVKQAFYKGYGASFHTLVDAHITSAVAGFVLITYGNPAVKGFAVTLLAGIVSTLFTSFYVTEVMGQWLVEKTRVRRFG